jgi:hypothetical protein
MPHSVELPDDLFAKLQKHAVPLVDTPVTVIERAVRALEQGDEEPLTGAAGSDAPRSFNPAAPPSLTHTKPRSAKVDGIALPYSEAYWNSIWFAVIRRAAARGVSTEDLLDLITTNRQVGRRLDNGFTYIEEANLSVQGQDANGAWRQTYVIASSTGIAVEVVFAWQNNPKAAMPNTVGSFHVEGSGQ